MARAEHAQNRGATQMKLGFLGTGTIATAVIRGLAGQGHQIRVSHRSRANSAQLAAEIPEVSAADNDAVVAESELVFLGLMAARAPEILAPLPFRADQQVVSFMADMALEQLATLVAPARAAAIMLPYPAIAQGGSPIPALGDIRVLTPLFTPANRIFPMQTPEQLAACLSAQAVLSPVTRLVAEAADWMGQGPEGEAFLRMLVATSLQAQGCADLLAALNTEGGYNQRLAQDMERRAMPQMLRDGLDRLQQGR